MKLTIILVVALFSVPASYAQTIDDAVSLVHQLADSADGGLAPVSTITFTTIAGITTFDVQPVGYWSCEIGSMGPTGGSASCRPALRKSALCLNTWVDVYASGETRPYVSGQSQCGSVNATCGNLLYATTPEIHRPAASSATILDEIIDILPWPPAPPTTFCSGADADYDLNDKTPWNCNVSWSPGVHHATGQCGLGDP